MEKIVNSLYDPPLIPSSTLDLYLTNLESIGIIGQIDHSLSPRVVTVLTSFLLDPHEIFVIFDDKNCTILRECCAQVLTSILDFLSKTGVDASLKKTTLFSGINKMHQSYQLFTTEENQIESKRIYENSISAISHLTRVLKPKETIDIAIPALVRRLEENSKYNEPIWDAMGNVGMTCDAEIFKTIIAFTLNNSHSIQSVSKISQTLARMPGRPIALLEMYLEKILGLFLEKAAQYHISSEPENIHDMRHLANLIRVVFDHENLATELMGDQNPDIMHQLRNMWFYLVLFVLGPDGTWPKEWYAILKSLARRSPPLVLDKKERSLEVNLGSDSILVATFPTHITSKIYTVLTNYIPNRAAEIRILSWPVCVYLTSIYQMELLRMKTLSLDFICGYLVDDRLQNANTYLVLESAANAVFGNAIKDSIYKKLPESIIEAHLQTLLIYSANRNQNVRQFVAVWIKKILAVVPQMLFNRSSVKYMLDILLYVDNVYAGHKAEYRDFSNQLSYISKNEARESAVDHFNLCQDWLGSAIKFSPLESLPTVEVNQTE